MHNIPQVSVADSSVDTSAPEWDAVQTGLRWNLISVIIGYVGLFCIMVASYMAFNVSVQTGPRTTSSTLQTINAILNGIGVLMLFSHLLIQICSLGLCCITPHSLARSLSIISLILLAFCIYVTVTFSQPLIYLIDQLNALPRNSRTNSAAGLFSFGIIAVAIINIIQHVFFCAYLLSLGYHLRAGELVHRTKGYLLTLVVTLVSIIVISVLSAVIMTALKIADFLPLVILVTSIMGFGFIAYRYIWALLGTRQLFRTKPEQLPVVLMSARPPAPPINPFE